MWSLQKQALFWGCVRAVSQPRFSVRSREGAMLRGRPRAGHGPAERCVVSSCGLQQCIRHLVPVAARAEGKPHKQHILTAGHYVRSGTVNSTGRASGRQQRGTRLTKTSTPLQDKRHLSKRHSAPSKLASKLNTKRAASLKIHMMTSWKSSENDQSCHLKRI